MLLYIVAIPQLPSYMYSDNEYDETMVSGVFCRQRDTVIDSQSTFFACKTTRSIYLLALQKYIFWMNNLKSLFIIVYAEHLTENMFFGSSLHYEDLSSRSQSSRFWALTWSFSVQFHIYTFSSGPLNHISPKGACPSVRATTETVPTVSWGAGWLVCLLMVQPPTRTGESPGCQCCLLLAAQRNTLFSLLESRLLTALLSTPSPSTVGHRE